MVLATEPATPPPPPPPPSTSANAAATVPAVLADSEVSVRDYRERLAELKSKNPFDQQFEVAAEEEEAGAAGGSPLDLGSGTTLPAGEDPGGAPLPAAGDTTSPAPTTTSATTDDTSGDSSPDDVKVVSELFTRRVDVQVGVQGDLRRRNGVKPMTILPNESNPVLAYLGTDEDGERAAFVISSDVSSVSGDGACVPSPSCLFITLEEGESVTLDYDVDGQTYELRLMEIRDVKLKAGLELP